MTRVLMLAKYSPSQPGGIETAVREFLKYIEVTSRGIELDVYCFGDNCGDVKIGEDVTIRDFRTTLTICSTPFSYSMLCQVRQEARSYDVVHLHLPNPWATILALLYCGRSRLIISVHGITTRYRLLQIPEKFLTMAALRRAHQIVVSASENVGPYGLDGYGSRITVIPYGVSDPSSCSVQLLQPFGQEPFFLFVGRLVYYKGLEYLIRAMSTVPGRLVIVGDGPLRGSLISLIQSLSLGDRVKMAGYVSQNMLANYYQSCLAFVLPSITVSESFGLSALEAMSFGKPLIVTRIGTGLETLVKDGENGFIVSPEDITELATALSAFLEDRDKARAFGEASRKLFNQRYSPQDTNAKLFELYQSI